MILLLCSLTASLSFGQISLHYEIHDKLCQKKIEVGFTWVQGVTDLLFFFSQGMVNRKTLKFLKSYQI